MDLIFWRHAEALDGTPDKMRELTAKGRKQARRMAKWLRARLPEDAIVLASPASRAQQTARALTEEFETVAAIDTSASAQDLLNAAGWPRGQRTVIVVGHQPCLGAAAALALLGRELPWQLKKGAVLWLTCDSRDTFNEPQLRALISPDLL
jgi:phosphohistidine phosphatase